MIVVRLRFEGMTAVMPAVAMASRIALSDDGAEWISAKPDFLVHVNALRRLFRGKVLGLLTEAHAEGRLQFFGHLVPLTDKKPFRRFLAPLRRIDWVVYCKDPFGGPQQVLRYLSRYTHRVAISNRLV
jgi:hypothetical protein